jgi:hypothetical protein
MRRTNVFMGGPPTLEDAGARSGTCQGVYENDNYGIAFGLCLQSGSADAACDVGATRRDPDAVRVEGSL